MNLSSVAARSAPLGLVLRGAFWPRPDDGVPALSPGREVGTLVLLGWVGRSGYGAFAASPEAADGLPDPLDRWSKRQVDALAADLGAHPLYPFGGPPYHPFQRWAQRAEPVTPSPLGLLIHPRWGLWHSYRGALAFAELLDSPSHPPAPSPCESCENRPCLSACPVGAFSGRGYDVEACAAHLRAPEGAPCRELGCLARRACPVGCLEAYGPAQSTFHMAAFIAARGDT